MPQLALETFISQYFWLLVIFFSFYFISITTVIPRISTLMKSREKISASTTTEESSTSETSADLDGTFQVVKESAYGLKENTNWKNYLGKWLSQEKGRTKKRGKKAAKSTKTAKSTKEASKASTKKTTKKAAAKKK